MKQYFSAIFILVLLIFASENLAQTPKNNWTRTESPNFIIISDASPEKARNTALLLEKNEAIFTGLFPEIEKKRQPTTVFLFSNGAELDFYKPRRADGTPVEYISALFQSGADTPAIISSIEGSDEDFAERLTHELGHSVIERHFGARNKIPLWLGEGLAEFLESVKLDAANRSLTLGTAKRTHIDALRRLPNLAFSSFLRLDLESLQESDHLQVDVFYAQSWAFVHFLINHFDDYNLDKTARFLKEWNAGEDSEKALKTAFGADAAQIESEFRRYLTSKKFPAKVQIFSVPDAEIKITPAVNLSSAEALTYLSDLLIRFNRFDDAEKYLQNALADAPDAPLTNLVYGNLKFEQNDFAAAQKALTKAVKFNHANYLTHFRTAYALVRISADADGTISSYVNADLIYSELVKAITLKPDFLDSYKVLANFAAVEEKFQPETLRLIEKLSPEQLNDGELIIVLANLYYSMDKFAEARKVLNDKKDVLEREAKVAEAARRLKLIDETEKLFAEYQRQRDEALKTGENPPIWLRNLTKIKVEPLTETETKRLSELSLRRAVGISIKRLRIDANEVFIGKLKGIECGAKSKISIIAENEKVVRKFSAQSIDAVELLDLEGGLAGSGVGCGVVPSNANAVFIAHRAFDGKSFPEVSAMVFVPQNFRFLTEAERKEEEDLHFRQLVIKSQKDSAQNIEP